eukprot:gene6744-1850_t
MTPETLERCLVADMATVVAAEAALVAVHLGYNTARLRRLQIQAFAIRCANTWGCKLCVSVGPELAGPH